MRGGGQTGYSGDDDDRFTMEVVMRFLFAVVVAGSLIVSPALAQQGGRGAAATPAVTGVIKSFDGKTLVLDAKEGAVSTVVTSSNT